VLFRPRRAGPMASSSQALNMLRGLAILLLYQGIGEAITHFSSIPIPGPVIGMVLLFLTLTLSGYTMPQWLGHTGHFMIRWLPLMFVPACVGLFFLPDTQADQWPAIISVIVLSTLITIATTAVVMKRLLRPEAEHLS
jgi:holin-like protein